MKTNLKKALALLLAMVLAATLIPFATVSAADEPTIQILVEETELNAGDEFEVTVNLLNIPAPGLICALVRLTWDEDAIEIVTYYDEDEEDTFNRIEVGDKYNASSGKYMSFGPPGTCNVNYLRATANENQTRYEEHFFTATFRVKDDAISGDYTIDVKQYNPKDFVRYGNLPTDFDIAPITVTVDGIDPPACQHAYDNACDADCNLCGEPREVAGHDWSDATCTAPKTCSVCGATEGDALGHTWSDATCTDPKTCSVCGATEGDALGHTWADATCTGAKTCSVCGTTEGEALGHDWSDATCTGAKTCSVCGATEGDALGHTSDAGTVTKKATCKATGVKTYKCTVCGEVLKTETIAKKAHTYTNACDKSCNACGATRTIKHSYKAATCTKAKTCKVCGATSGKKLGHKYTNACDTTCNTCKATRKITHSYKTVTKKATQTANGYTVKRCSVCKKETGKTTIYKASKISLSKTAYTYNGKAQKPTVTVKDSKGNKIASSNYTITYASGRKNVGTYKVTIKFKGKYSGTKTLTYKINPVKTTVSKLTAAKKGFKATITKKTTQVTGYEVQYSTTKAFKTVKTKTLTSYKKNTLTLTGLKAKTTYYVRVRTYKTVNGKKYYSGWSAVKTVKTK